MIIYAHRCNINGSDHKTENTLAALHSCLNKGIRCEIDVRFIDGKLYLGHDKPQEEVSIDFLAKNRVMLLVHCKNVEAFKLFRKFDLPFFHYFYQANDYIVQSSLMYDIHHQNSDFNEFDSSDIVIDLHRDKKYGQKVPYAIVSDFQQNKE